jgi:hypothetical protein
MIHSIILGVPIRGLLHDISKLTPLEWVGIGRQFCSSSTDEKARNGDLFKEAKEHHRKLNKHEMDHWYQENGECLPVQSGILKEAMADWAAFGGLCLTKGAIRRYAGQCYAKWARNYRMHEDTRKWIEDFVAALDVPPGS